MSGTIGNNPYRASGVVAAAAGAGGVTWCSAIKTGAFCAEAGNGYFINTCGGTFEVTLPAAAEVGDLLHFTDYARTWGTACKELTLNQNSLKFQGQTTPKPEYDTTGATVKIVYSGATQGWIPQLDKGTELETPQTYSLQYLVVAGGGAGGGARTSYYGAGGGGAGGPPGSDGVAGTANLGGGGGGGSGNPSASAGGNGGPGGVILRSSTSFTTDSACAPVTYNGTDYIGTFKAGTNINLGTANPFIGADYLVVAGGGSGGSTGAGDGGGGGGGGG